MKKHVNVALFVPHAGCPHTCSFCNQKTISGRGTPLTPEQVHKAAAVALDSGGKGGEIAFFGGSFTAIDREYMLSLLQAAAGYVEAGLFSGIRCSTRPDCVNEDVLAILQRYHVRAVELGAQSMDDGVLLCNERGHTAQDTRIACEKIRAAGMQAGLQMMTGLYGDTPEKDWETARAFCRIAPDTVRIYPTLVLEGTALARLYRQGAYQPQSLEDAAGLCARLLLLFHRHHIPVIRLGLHSGGDVENGLLAGPYHPAFREICESRIYREILQKQLSALPAGSYRIQVAPTEISKAIGQKRENIQYFSSLGYTCRVESAAELPVYTARISAREITG